MPQVCPKGESPGRSGRYAIRIDTNRPGVYRWLITMDGRLVLQPDFVIWLARA